jgi:amino acid transporter
MYTMGRAGTLPAPFATIHPVHQTPSFAISFAQVFGLVSVLLVGLLLKPAYIFGFLETIATLAVIVLYAMANLALTSYMRREHREHFGIWQHLVVPWTATLVLLPVLIVTLYPLPPWPYSLAPYLFVLGLGGGFAYLRWCAASDPAALPRGGTMLVGRRSGVGGEVDWDAGQSEARQPVSSQPLSRVN